jgi:hypothetical protein
MQGLKRLGVIQELSRKDSKWKHKDLFKILRKEDIWIAAYQTIKSNPGIGIPRLRRLQFKVLDESYKFSQSVKPISNTSNDKIVQEVIRIILEAIYKPIFDHQSFDFVHDALQHVEKQFRSMDWVIESDIKSASLDKNRLCEIIRKRIDDPRFMGLIRKSLTSGRFLPIYVNIYFNELDEWVRQKAGLSFYTRYADDWIIGIRGPRHLATEIKNKLESFLKFHLIHPDKTKITNIRAGKVFFLGYYIFLPRNMKIGKSNFQMPVDQVIKRMKERGYITYDKNNKVRPISKASYTQLEDALIVNHFRKVWLGLKNFYSGSSNRSHLQYIHYLFHISCAMTLAHRHRSSVKKIMKKHGKRLEIMDKTVSPPKRITAFPYEKKWKIADRKWQCARPFVYIQTEFLSHA